MKNLSEHAGATSMLHSLSPIRCEKETERVSKAGVKRWISLLAVVLMILAGTPAKAQFESASVLGYVH